MENLDTIVNALAVIYDPKATNEARSSAQQYCDSVKENPAAQAFAHQLAHQASQYSDTVRHFGLSLLENAIRYRWNDASCDDSQRAKLRDTVVDLVFTGTRNITIEKTFIKEKVVRLFVEIAKRQWPTEWPDMENILLRMYEQEPKTRELSLLILRSLAEDVFVYEDPVADIRKKTLRAALTRLSSSDVALQSQYAGEVMEGGVNMVAAAGDPGWMNRIASAADSILAEWNVMSQTSANQDALVLRRLAIVTVETLVPYMDWILPRTIVEAKLLPRLCNLIGSPISELRLAAVEALASLFNRNFPKTDDVLAVVGPVIDGEGMNVLCAGYNSMQGADPSEHLVEDEDYVFLKKFAQAVVNLGCTQLCQKSIYATHSVPSQFNTYLELVYKLSNHPSNAVSSTTFPFWIAVLKNDSLSSKEHLMALIPSLLEMFAQKLVIIDDHEEITDAALTHYNTLDFETRAEYQESTRLKRNRAVEIIKLVVPLKPLESFDWMSNRIRTVLGMQPDTKLKDGTTYHALLDATVILLEAVISGLPKTLIKVPIAGNDREKHLQLMSSMNRLLEQLITFNSNDLSIITRQLTAIAAFGDMMALDHTLLFSSLEKIFSFITFKVPEGDIHYENAFLLRRKAGASLVKLATLIPDVLIGFYPDISRSVMEIINAGLQTPYESTVLLEFLLTIGVYSTASADLRKGMFDAIVGSVVESVSAPFVQNVLASTESFAEAIGLHFLRDVVQDMKSKNCLDMNACLVQRDPTLAGPMQTDKTTRAQLFFAINSVFILLKRTIDQRPKNFGEGADTMQLWVPYIENIMPTVMAGIKTLHGLWNRANWTSYPQEMQVLLNIGESEKFMILGATMTTSTHGDIALQTPSSLIAGIRSWMGTLRDACYHVTGSLTLTGAPFYSTPSRMNVILNSLFDNVVHIANHHWRGLLSSVLLPYVTNCPLEFMPQAFDALLPSLLGFLDTKLRSEWRAMMARGLCFPAPDEGMTNETDTTIEASDEIVAEKILRDLTRAYADVLSRILMPKDSSKEEKLSTQHPSAGQKRSAALEQYLLTTPAVAEPLLYSLIRLLTFKDTSSTIKTSATCQRILPQLVKHTQYHVFVGREMLTAAMEALHDGYHLEGHASINGLITEIYLQLRPLSSVPYETFAGLPGMSPDRLKVFEDSLAKEIKTKSKAAIVQHFLHSITGLAAAQWGKKEASVAPAKEHEKVRIVRSANKKDRFEEPEISLDDFFRIEM